MKSRLAAVIIFLFFLSVVSFAADEPSTVTIRSITYKDESKGNDYANATEISAQELKKIESSSGFRTDWAVIRHIKPESELEDITRINDCTLELKLSAGAKKAESIRLKAHIQVQSNTAMASMNADIDALPNRNYILFQQFGGTYTALHILQLNPK